MGGVVGGFLRQKGPHDELWALPRGGALPPQHTCSCRVTHASCGQLAKVHMVWHCTGAATETVAMHGSCWASKEAPRSTGLCSSQGCLPAAGSQEKEGHTGRQASRRPGGPPC